jgi:hypothetical protein
VGRAFLPASGGGQKPTVHHYLLILVIYSYLWLQFHGVHGTPYVLNLYFGTIATGFRGQTGGVLWTGSGKSDSEKAR